MTNKEKILTAICIILLILLFVFYNKSKQQQQQQQPVILVNQLTSPQSLPPVNDIPFPSIVQPTVVQTSTSPDYPPMLPQVSVQPSSVQTDVIY